MKPSIHNKLESLAERLEEINALLAEPEVINDQNRFRSLSQEYAPCDAVGLELDVHVPEGRP